MAPEAGIQGVMHGRDSAICDATLALLVEVGYDRMSMDAVAARARASKATIYRRWPGKPELVLDEARELALATGDILRIGPMAAARAEAAWLEGDKERTRDEVAGRIREALGVYVEEMSELGQSLPAPTATAETVQAA